MFYIDPRSYINLTKSKKFEGRRDSWRANPLTPQGVKLSIIDWTVAASASSESQSRLLIDDF